MTGTGARVARFLSTGIAVALVLTAITMCRARPEEGPSRRPPPERITWPLTGLIAPSKDAARIRVVSVKIENSDAARPQSGLSQADIVYETLTEGGITRFNALYHSRRSTRVGPVRSARLSDIYIVPQYRALFARAGANFVVESRVKAEGIEDMNEFTNPGPYERSSERKAPHNLYVDIGKLRDAALQRGYESRMDPPRLAFGVSVDSSGTTGTAITVPFRRLNRVGWRWDAAGKRYLRDINGQPQRDAGSTSPYSAVNVIVIFARTEETAKRDVRGSTTLEIKLVGSGQAIVFRDGRRYDGTWAAGDDAPPHFRDSQGEDLPLALGQTWIEVVPAGFAVESR